MSGEARTTAEAERLAARLASLRGIEDACYFLAGDLFRAGLSGLASDAESLGAKVAREHERLRASKAAGRD